jgi:DNA helicase II / ATP-dependent DNA helicase PcrA
MFEIAERQWLDELNPQQRAAVTHTGSPLLVIAGAGTGKTTTLCARVAWLQSEGVPAERMLLLTFTRRAAREMVQRARGMSQRATSGQGRILGGTFHSVAQRMIRVHASSLGLDGGFGVLDASDATGLLDIVRQKLGHAAATGRRFPRASGLLSIYSRTVNAQQPLNEVVAESVPWCEEHLDALAEIFRAYVSHKRELGVLDLDDLLLYWRALANDEVIGAQIASTFDHVLVDEYQDVNGLQVDILRSLGAKRCEVTAVGDDFQAIYGFRSASAAHILDFPNVFPDAHIVKLEQNYRSTTAILEVANAISRQDVGSYARKLWSEREDGRAPVLSFPRDEADQAQEVCDNVLSAREEGMLLREQAVLFRTGHDSDLLELELTRRGIPFVKYGGLRYLEAGHVKDLIALLRLATNPSDELSWFRVLQLIDGVGPQRAQRILDALRPSEDEPADVSRWAEAAEHVPNGSLEQATAMIEALAEPNDESTGAHVEQLCGVLTPLIRMNYPDWAIRIEDYEQLLGLARGAEDIRHFVSELVIDPPSCSQDLTGPPHLDDDYLVLSTIHSVKGLEWDAVHVIAAYDGNFPADLNAGTAEGVGEERRVFYVGLTRSKTRLHVYVPKRFYYRPQGRDDRHGFGRASRFLTKEVQQLFETRHAGTEEMRGLRPAPTTARIEVSVDALFG